jgi:ABC-type uncharacterized transport system substrate-binding protein
VKRRQFLRLAGGAAIVCPFGAYAQQTQKRVGVLSAFVETDPEAQARIEAFRQELERLGWIDGRNIKIDYRWSGSNAERAKVLAQELVSLSPDVLLATNTLSLAMLKQATTSVPIVFVQVTDPVRGGFVRSLAHPGGNITGFSSFEYAIVGKWLDLLKDVAPNVSDILVMHDPKSAASSAQSSTMESLASSRGLKLKFAPVRDAADIEKVLGQVASSNTALSVLPDPVTVVNGALIARLANEHHMPAIYPLRFFAAKGGLMSYGNDTLDLHRRAATYVDRILKGEKPENLPVQAPTKFELVINLKTAKIVGLTIPRDLLATADDIIE